MYTIEDINKMKYSTETSAYNIIGDKINGIAGIYKIGIEALGEKGGVQIGISCYREHRGPSIHFSTNKINNVFLTEVPNGLMMTVSCNLTVEIGSWSYVRATFSRLIYNINYTSLRYITEIKNIIDDHIIIDEIMKTIITGRLFFISADNLLKHNIDEKVIT
ncbi:MAG: hypothetical protein HRT51_06600 [Colwellia sp.]|nr:hypothetical protein [Colwellia sp.]